MGIDGIFILVCSVKEKKNWKVSTQKVRTGAILIIWLCDFEFAYV